MTQVPAVGFCRTLSQAYRHACRTGVNEIGTDLVLYHAISRVRLLRANLPGRRDRIWRAVAGGRSGHTDPAPPARTRLTPRFDDDVAFEADAVLRETAFMGATRARPRSGTALPVFTPAVRSAVYEAIHEASRRELEHARAEHLALALLSVPDGAAAMVATELLRERWIPGSVGGLVDGLRADERYRTDGVRPQGEAQLLMAAGVLPGLRPRPLLGGAWRLSVRLALGLWLRRPYRRYGARYGHPLPCLVDSGAPRQAARAGQDVVTGAHVMLSILDLADQLASTGRALPGDVARWNEAAAILAGHGVTLAAATRAAAALGVEPSDRERAREGIPTRGWWKFQPVRPGVPESGRTALLAMRESSLDAHRRGHPYTGTTHVLAALLADPAGPAARLLRALDFNPDVIREEATRCLSALS